MIPVERKALEALLAQMRAIHETPTVQHAGLCVPHREAAIAARESYPRRGGTSPIGQVRHDLASSQETH